jgi:porin
MIMKPLLPSSAFLKRGAAKKPAAKAAASSRVSTAKVNAGTARIDQLKATAFLPVSEPLFRPSCAPTRKSNFLAIAVQLAALLSVFVISPLSAEESQTGGEATVNADATRPASWLERDTLSGDWAGHRIWLKEQGITLAPRLTQFYQGLAAGDGDHDFEYGGKVDLMVNADLNKLGFWKGFSLTVHGEYNYSESINGAGGTLVPTNTALVFPGMEDADALDLSSVYFQQQFGGFGSLLVGKINMMDIAARAPFKGGAGIDAFWNLTFVAPPSGLVPPYLFGALMSVRTEPATFGLWVYDPASVVNKTGFEEPFANGVTIRGSVDFPVTIGGLSGHQGLVALYSTESGTDLDDIGDTFLPPFPPDYPDIKNDNYLFAYSFDQYLYRVSENSREGFGLFGQFGISDGNPSRLYWSALAGIGGTGLIPGRSRDNWGIGYYYDAPSRDLQDSLSSVLTIRDEQGVEIFYNFAVTLWLAMGADLQVINPSMGDDTVVIPGLRSVTRF